MGGAKKLVYTVHGWVTYSGQEGPGKCLEDFEEYERKGEGEKMEMKEVRIAVRVSESDSDEGMGQNGSVKQLLEGKISEKGQSTVAEGVRSRSMKVSNTEIE